AFTYELYEVLGIFIPLIVTNCAILGRADAFACKNPILPSVVDGFMMAMGFTVVLVILGAMREIIGQGVVFSNMDLLFGPSAAHWKIELISGYPDFLFAILPPGAFVAMGLLIAGKNIIDARIKRRAEAQKVPVQAGAKRARVTGKIS
ncbi:MAG: electron transport complex subunit RsxE, partial [Thalassolituus oleivorans]|nr:electron transport complex subunit RsxE [Thalassolituus oleivorans]